MADAVAPVTGDPSSNAEVDKAEARVGQPLNAKWTLESLLGVGGMGAVYAAKHRNGSRAAVKLLHAEFARDVQIRERFLREGKIANRVDHPARVPVTDDDVSDTGEPFLVMDLLEGETLGQLRVRSGGKVPLEETLRIFDPVLELLSKCHAAGIVHRDVKPANVFITNTGDVKVLDFGVARMRESDSSIEATRAGTAIGTPSYMAPEQALGLGGQVDGRSDVWSVGACMYVSLTGQRLNVARTEAESFVMAATQAAPSIANLAKDLPVEVVAFVDKALAFERGKRFQDAASMRSELLGLLNALRAGQLVVAAPKKVGGVKARGNEALETDELSDKDKLLVYDKLAGVWKQLGICLADVRQYGWTHPQSTRTLQLGYQQIVDMLATYPGSLRWDVGPGAFLFEAKPVWAPDRMPFDRIPYQLFADGVRRIQIKQGITEDELRDLVAIFLRDLGDGVATEGDSVTALWDRRFEHVAYLAIDSFAEGEAGDPGQQGSSGKAEALADSLATLARLDRDMDDMTLEERAMQKNLTAQLKESGEAAAALAIDPLTRATLGAQLNLSEDKWRERFVDAFVAGYFDARTRGDLASLESALREWTGDQLALHSHAVVFELFQSISDKLVERAPAEELFLRRAVAAVMLPSSNIAAILQDLEKEGRDQTRAAKEIDPAIVVGIGKALELLGDGSMLALACGCYDSFRSEPLRDVLLAYVKRWVKGHEMELGGVIESAGVDLGVLLVKLLGELQTPASANALERALGNPNLAVRIEALARMPSEKEDHVRDEVQKMLDNQAASVRTEALRLIAARELRAAGPALVIRVQSPAFHEMPVEERRQWLRAIAALNPRRAESLCAGILAAHTLIPQEAVEATRTLAAELLAGSASDEALAAAQEASKKRWWNTQPVRDAAERALKAITERRAGGATGAASPQAARRKEETP